MIVKLEISSPLNYSQILDQQKFRSMTKKKMSTQDNSPWLLAWLSSEEMQAYIKTDESICKSAGVSSKILHV